MKSNKIIKRAVVVIIMFSTVSCNEWLNLEPENDLIRQEFWKKESDVDAVVAAMYDAFREMSLESLIWGELRGDLIEIGSRFPEYSQIANNDIVPSNGVIDWKGYYVAINLANTLLQFAGEVVELDDEFKPREKEAIDAEAIFIRSLSYFYLVRLWKDVPFVLSASSSDTINLFLPKEEERVILNGLIQDLERAEKIAYSTENKSIDNVFRGRANKFSIQALMADIYLWLENYNKCVEYCDKIINSNQYELMGTDNWFELYYPGNSRESIFEIQFNSSYSKETNPIYDGLTPLSGTAGATASDKLIEIYTTADIRYVINKDLTKKYISTGETGVKRSDNENDANIIYYRYSDILLMKAEALMELEQFMDAGNYINMVMERAGLPRADVAGKDGLRELLLLERGREFLFEGKRWFDLLRFAKRNHFEKKEIVSSILLSKATIKNRPKVEAIIQDTMFYYLPVPERELNANHNLEQNPFYDK